MDEKFNRRFTSFCNSLDALSEAKNRDFSDSFVLSGTSISSDEKEWDTNYDIAKAADARMYENKAAYYQKSGRDRRKR